MTFAPAGSRTSNDVDFLSLTRKAGREPFSDTERTLFELLMPHVAEAFRHCSSACLARVRRSGKLRGETSAGLLDDAGSVLAAEYGFDRLLSALRADDRPRCALASRAARCGGVCAPAASDRAVQVQTERVDDIIVVQLGRRALVASLSARERLVAERFASGATYREIADELDRSPTTIRNQIRSVYAKLGVTNKVGLVRSLRRRT